MEYRLLFRKAKTVKDYRIDYLDERSEFSHQVKSRRDNIDHERLCGEVEKGLDYFSKEKSFGRVYAGGFLREMIQQETLSRPESLDRDLVKKLTSKYIQEHSQNNDLYRGAYGHHCIISMHKDFMIEIEELGGNVDYYLAKALKRSLLAFQKEFHPGEKIGFAFGIHHDTKNRHAHIFIHNRTLKSDGSKGSHVAMSNPLKGKFDPKPRKDQVGFMKKEMIKQARWIINDIKRNNRLKQQHKVKHEVRHEVNQHEYEPLLSVEKNINKSHAELLEINNQKSNIRQKFNTIQAYILNQNKLSQKKIDELLLMSQKIRSFKAKTQPLQKINHLVYQSHVNRSMLKMTKLFVQSRQKVINSEIHKLIESKKEKYRLLNEIKKQYQEALNHCDIEKKVVQSRLASEKNVYDSLLKVLPILKSQKLNSRHQIDYKLTLEKFKQHNDPDRLYSELSMLSNFRHNYSNSNSYETEIGIDINEQPAKIKTSRRIKI